MDPQNAMSWNIDLESKYDRPDKSERESRISVDDIMGTHVLQMHPLFIQECQRLVHIFQTMDSHFALGRIWLGVLNEQLSLTQLCY